MNYITDYQLDTNKGFMCKVNGITFNCEFKFGQNLKWFVSQILLVADAMEIPRQEFIGIFNNKHVNHVIYCDSKQQCYDLCQHIVKTYFKPADIERDIISFRCGNESYKFELKLLSGKYVWKNRTDPLKHIVNKSSIDIKKVKEELNIKIYEIQNLGYLGFDNREDALKFAKWIKESLYDKQEVCEKSREQLKHYYHGTYQVNFPNGTFVIRLFNPGGYFWSTTNPNMRSRYLYEQFELSTNQVLEICNNLKIKAYFSSNILVFDSKEDAIKFTDYLIETYIIKKEKTYDTNQLRKERTAISRGAKPAGSIIHGRRSKASVRCGCIEHKACLGI